MYYVPRYQVMLVREGSVSFESYPRFTNSQGLFDRFSSEFNKLDREVFSLVTLDSKHKLIGLHTISTGSLRETFVHPRECLKPAILDNACAVIALHNHPSGDPTPSKEDRELTKRLHAAFDLVGVPFLDHIIIGETTYFSFADSFAL